MVKSAKIIIGANYGDEGKGTVTARYTRDAEGSVLNILTNGGPQRGHSILTPDGSITYQHFGSGTYYGADNYYSKYFILNPMQFVDEYQRLIVKPKNIYRNKECRWTTLYDAMANLIEEQGRGRHASCCMGIWNTIKRYNDGVYVSFDQFINNTGRFAVLDRIKEYYEKKLTIPVGWKDLWDSKFMQQHFISDCMFTYQMTKLTDMYWLDYDNLIFENGQGLLLKDTGKDTYDTTPSDTGISYALELLRDMPDVYDVTAHYVTRPYLTRHGDGEIMNDSVRSDISEGIEEDRTNHYNDFQGEFRYGKLDIDKLHDRIMNDANGTKFEIDLTHCDEMDRVDEFRKKFENINTYDKALV